MNAQNSPTPADGDRVVDLRALAPRDRHALVFDTRRGQQRQQLVLPFAHSGHQVVGQPQKERLQRR
jgi:hypothetical protein